jgi:hypothetical protein
LKEHCKVLCAEHGSGSLVEVDPDPERPDYMVVNKIQGVDGPNKCLQHNIGDSLLFVNSGNSIAVKQVNPNKGVQNTRVVIPTYTKSNNPNIPVEIEAYEPVGYNALITGNNFGVLEGFSFDINSGKHRKVFEKNLNQNLPPSMQNQITSMSVSEDQRYLAVATMVSNQRVESCLSKLFVFGITNAGLRQIAVKEFFDSNANSLYYYINFEYKFKGVPLIFAFQDADEYRLDIYAFENQQLLKLIHSKKGFHRGDFSAIRALGGQIVSVDYEGEMRILTIPEG